MNDILVCILITLIVMGFQIFLNWWSGKFGYTYSTKAKYAGLAGTILLTGLYINRWILPTGLENFNIPLLTLLLTIPLLVTISIIDWKYYEIPNRYNLALAILGIAFVITKGDLWLNFVLGGVIATLVLLILSILTGGNLGLGDVKMVFGLGMFVGKGMLLSFMFATFLSGALISIILLILKLKTPKDRIAFGPYIAFGFISLFLF